MDKKTNLGVGRKLVEVTIGANRPENLDYITGVMYAAPKVGNTTFCASVGKTAVYNVIHGLDYEGWDEKEKNTFRREAKKIVIGVRDAVAQNISLIWHFTYWNSLLLGRDGDNVQRVFDYFVNDSICREQERRKEHTYGYESCAGVPLLLQSWFDDELLKELNIDIYRFPFDCEKGYSIYENVDGHDIMIYQLEKMSGLTEEFRDFTGIQTFEIQRVNDASDKSYLDSYYYFKENMEMSRDYLEKTYNGKMMQHFYSDKDIAKFQNKWEKNIRR